MKTNSLCLGIVPCLLVGIAAFGNPAAMQIFDRGPTEQRVGVIKGRVLAEDSGDPLAKATVSLRSTGGRGQNPPQTVRTDNRGDYVFRNVAPGQYMLRAARNSYLPRNHGQKASHSFSTEKVGTALRISAGQVVDGIDFRLIRAGVVEGSVVDQDNEPLERIRVMLRGYRRVGGRRRLLPMGQGETDDRGRFRIFGIAPGSYLLSASPQAFIAQRNGVERPFPPTYYPGVLRAAEAAPVQVTAGLEVGGFNITLMETLTYNVSGRVLTPEGKLAHSVWIVSSDESDKDAFAMAEKETRTNLQGEFTVSGLLPGRHRLYARSGQGDDLQLASTAVEVADEDVRGLTLVLGMGAEIAGRIVVDREDSDLDWRRISLDMVPTGNASRIQFGGTRSQVKEDSTFKISNLVEGTYRLVVKLPQGNHYVDSIRVKGQEITDRPIEMRNNDWLPGVEVRVSSEGAGISGYVEKAEDREAAEGATVLVFADDPERRGSASRFTRTTQTDQRGQFFLEGLVPGEYLVCALGDHEAGNEMDPGYLESVEKDSERIDLSPGETVEGSLVALPAPTMN